MASHQLCLTILLFLLAIGADGESVRRELTTRSWDEMGFHENVKRSPLEDDIIIGIIDTGIWPESESFNDEGLGPPPKRWKGICQTNGFNFTCNNKLIGARFYVPDPSVFNLTSGDELSPRDNTDHGTHVASTAAGVPVKEVSMGGLKKGTARGGVPRARIAMYKVCWGLYDKHLCIGMGKAIDDAIRDGVDIISMSIGVAVATNYHLSDIAIGSFRAMRHGILVSVSAGNGGPDEFSIDNTAPWLLTVANSFTAASEFATYVTLGNGKRLEGHLINLNDNQSQKPIVLGWKVTNDTNQTTAKVCNPNYLSPELTKGKIVLCPELTRFLEFEKTGIAGVILNCGDKIDVYKEDYFLAKRTVPIVAVSGEDFAYLVSYYHNSSTSDSGRTVATANIARTIEVGGHSLPHIASSSSRGPNFIDMYILKPDVSAPGVNILAAVTGNRYDGYTGTSMACPHVTGAAAYVKSFHPTWSPAAIKSALITTATPMEKNPLHALAYGAGQISPVDAVEPGLIYDIDANDYLKYICAWTGLRDDIVLQITNDSSFNCPNVTFDNVIRSFNLPAFSIPYKSKVPFEYIFNRTVTNVGYRKRTTYQAMVAAPKGINIEVYPNVLAFNGKQQKLTYTVSICGKLEGNSTVHSATLVWTNGKHYVRSPIAIFPLFDRDAVERERYRKGEDIESILIPRIV